MALLFVHVDTSRRSSRSTLLPLPSLLPFQAKRVSSNISQTAQQSAVWLRGLSLRVMSLTSASDSDEGGESTSTPSHLDTTSVSGSSTHPWIGRREGAGVPGRLASRLRPSGTAAPGVSLGMTSSAAEGGCNGGCGGLPASTPSSSCDLASAAGPPPHVQSPLALSPALASLRQKWQELEATAGDGTKQFLVRVVMCLSAPKCLWCPWPTVPIPRRTQCSHVCGLPNNPYS